jgi:hypothetical protein
VTPRLIDPGAVLRFIIVNDSVAFAVYDTATQGWILQLGPLRWDAIGSDQPNVAKGIGLPASEGIFYDMEIDRTTSPATLFVATDSNVYISRDMGNTWQLASLGLPQRPHCAGLQFAAPRAGVHYLYLSTYGRSVWRAKLSP